MDFRIITNLSLLIFASFVFPEARSVGARSVVFFDAPGHRYIRENSLNPAGKVSSISVDEVAATISVLLGFAPSPSLNGDSSAMLNEVLLPNPFDRPRAVFAMEVVGVEDQLLPTDQSISKVVNTFISRVVGSTLAKIELPGEAEVSVVPLDESLAVECDATCINKELQNFAQLFGGSFVGSLEALDGEVSVPLASGATLNLHVAKKADQQFALSLVSLIRSVKKAVEIHEDLAESSVNPAELLLGRFMGIKALEEEYGRVDITDHGLELFQMTLAKVFDILQQSYGGKIVGVAVCSKEASPDLKAMFDVSFSSHASRVLDESSHDSETIVAMLLVRRSLAWITGIILLISTVIGVYLLVNMPLTRDTLLYSNVKVD